MNQLPPNNIPAASNNSNNSNNINMNNSWRLNLENNMVITNMLLSLTTPTTTVPEYFPNRYQFTQPPAPTTFVNPFEVSPLAQVSSFSNLNSANINNSNNFSDNTSNVVDEQDGEKMAELIHKARNWCEQSIIKAIHDWYVTREVSALLFGVWTFFMY